MLGDLKGYPFSTLSTTPFSPTSLWLGLWLGLELGLGLEVRVRVRVLLYGQIRFADHDVDESAS